MKLVKLNLAPSREKAKELILSGHVFVDGKSIYKPDLDVEDHIIVVDRDLCLPQFVSRGAYKLMWASREFGVSFQDKLVLDLGSSTGGFTDFALKEGARKVICVDVGYGLLDWKLRNDQRVFLMERTNARYLNPENVPYLAQIVVADLSFISLKLIIPAAARCSDVNAEFLLLLKPQFEVGREKVLKGGVVKDIQAVKNAILDVCRTMKENRVNFNGITFSPIKNRRGNIEYFLYVSKAEAIFKSDDEIAEEVDEAMRRAINFFEIEMKR